MNTHASSALLSKESPCANVVGGGRRVLFIAYDFPPAATAGAQSCWQIARFLPHYGWTPIILAAHERGLNAVVPGSDARTNMLLIRPRSLPHPLGAYRLLKSLIPTRASVRSASNSPPDSDSPSPGTLRSRMLSLLMLPDAYTGWLAPALLRGLAATRRYGVEHLLSSAPCWTNHLVGLLLARITHLPWTVHFRDPWMQVPAGKPTSALSLRIESALEKAVVTRATTVVCVTERHTAALRRWYPFVPAHRFVTIPNGYDESQFAALETAPNIRPPQFTMTYTGDLYQRRNPQPIFRALRRLLDLGIIATGSARFDLIGPCGTAEGRSVPEMVVQHGLTDYVTMTGPIGKTEALRHLCTSDLLILFAEGLTLQIPSKTYEYLRSGHPILALTSEGAVADLLRMTGGAWVVDAGDDARILEAIASAYDAWKSSGIVPTADPRAVGAFDRRVLAGRFSALFDATKSTNSRRICG